MPKLQNTYRRLVNKLNAANNIPLGAVAYNCFAAVLLIYCSCTRAVYVIRPAAYSNYMWIRCLNKVVLFPLTLIGRGQVYSYIAIRSIANNKLVAICYCVRARCVGYAGVVLLQVPPYNLRAVHIFEHHLPACV